MYPTVIEPRASPARGERTLRYLRLQSRIDQKKLATDPTAEEIVPSHGSENKNAGSRKRAGIHSSDLILTLASELDQEPPPAL